MIKLCIFDMDGLLIDSERYMWSVSMAIAAKKQGFTLTQEVHNTFRGMNFKSVGEILCNEFGPNFNYDLFLKDMHENNKHIIEEGIPLRPGVQELLDYLRQNNIKTCIGTTTPRSTCDKILNTIGITSYFDGVVCGDEITNGKPNPEIYLTCLAKFDGISKEEAIIFEDGQSGALAALAAGMKLVLVPDLAKLEDNVKSKAYKIIDNIKEIIPTIESLNNL